MCFAFRIETEREAPYVYAGLDSGNTTNPFTRKIHSTSFLPVDFWGGL